MKLEIISREPQTLKFDSPLLFVHGSCHAAWCYEENFLPYFTEKGFSSHAVSLRGHGASEGNEKLNWASIRDYVEDVFQAAKQLPKTPVLIGHSLGGLVVQKFLENYEAKAAILLAPSPSNGMFKSGSRLFFQNPLLFTKVFLRRDFQIIYGTPELVKKNLFSFDADEEKIKKYTRRLGKESFRAAMEMIYNLPNPKSVKTPILVLGGENDIIVPPREIKKTAAAFNGDYKIFPNTAHDLMLERNWQTVADFMINWLRKTIQSSRFKVQSL
jgi:pimeloyl-ACP methyl ester carboxylesterase